MEAIVLAGGLGTRLRSIVTDVPKPMAPIGDKPFLYYLFKYLKNNGVDRVILSVGYKWEIIQNYLGNNFDGIQVIYSVEDEPLGTGGAIKKAMNKVNSNDVFIINGDTFFDVDLNELKKNVNNESKLTLSLKNMHDFDRYGCVESDSNGIVIAFTEKEYRKVGNINGGIYLVKRDIFENYDLDEKFSFEEFMQNNLHKLKINSFVFNKYFIDIGIPEDYRKAQNELKKHI